MLVGAAGLALVALPLWLSSDALRHALEAQATAALDRPVRIAAARITLLPRLSVALSNVTVGEPPRARVDEVSIALGLGVLWSRRVEAADVRLTGGEFDSSALAAMAAAPPPDAAAPGAAIGGSTPLTIISIRSIRLREVTLLAGDRRVPISLDAALDGDQLTLSDLSAQVGDATLHLAGGISSLARREGRLDLRADVLPVMDLIAVLGNLMPTGSADAAPSDPARIPFRLTATIAAPAAILGARRADDFSATLEATAAGIVLDPMVFTLDSGRFEMRMVVDPFERKAPVETSGRVSGLDVARLQAATSVRKESLAGRLDGRFALRAPPRADLPAMFAESRGSIDLDIRDGRMPGIAIVRQAVLRFADRAGPPPNIDATDAFSHLQASLTVQPDAARITRLAMKAADFDLEGHGALSPRDWRMGIDATVTLTEELSQQAGRDLYRYAHDGKRIVLPVVLDGTLFQPTATIDVGKAAGRAIKNRIEDEVQSIFERLIKKRPPT